MLMVQRPDNGGRVALFALPTDNEAAKWDRRTRRKPRLRAAAPAESAILLQVVERRLVE